LNLPKFIDILVIASRFFPRSCSLHHWQSNIFYSNGSEFFFDNLSNLISHSVPKRHQGIDPCSSRGNKATSQQILMTDQFCFFRGFFSGSKERIAVFHICSLADFSLWDNEKTGPRRDRFRID